MRQILDLTENWCFEAYDLWLQNSSNTTNKINKGDFLRSWSCSSIKKCVIIDGKIVAIGRAYSDGVYSIIYDIVVHNNDQENRKLLLKSIVRELKQNGIRKIQLMVEREHIPFYQKLEFVFEQPDKFGKRFSLLSISD